MSTRTRRSFAAGALALTLAVASCATTMDMQTSQAIPAAQGEVKVRDQRDGNARVDVRVRHLAPPQQLARDGTHYVVWVQPLDRRGDPQNLGVLSVGDNREGRLRGTTPFEQFELFVTLEPDDRASEPTGERLLWSRSN
jgi:muconolactone delta-isomerase